MLHLIINKLIKKGCIIMKKATTLLLSLGMLANSSIIGHCAIAPKAKNSVYLPHDSWVVAKLQEKMEAAHYEPAEGWKDKISVGYTCVDSGAPTVETMSSVIQSSWGAGISVPLKKGTHWFATDVYGGIKLEGSQDITNIIDVISAKEPPAGVRSCKVEIYNPGSNFETYDHEITAMEREQGSVLGTDFTFNDETKIYQVNMGIYTYGYILQDDQDRKLFWCCKAANDFEKGKFYKLADVLNAYKEYKERTMGINSGYTRWV